MFFLRVKVKLLQIAIKVKIINFFSFSELVQMKLFLTVLQSVHNNGFSSRELTHVKVLFNVVSKSPVVVFFFDSDFLKI